MSKELQDWRQRKIKRIRLILIMVIVLSFIAVGINSIIFSKSSVLSNIPQITHQRYYDNIDKIPTIGLTITFKNRECNKNAFKIGLFSNIYLYITPDNNTIDIVYYIAPGYNPRAKWIDNISSITVVVPTLRKFQVSYDSHTEYPSVNLSPYLSYADLGIPSHRMPIKYVGNKLVITSKQIQSIITSNKSNCTILLSPPNSEIYVKICKAGSALKIFVRYRDSGLFYKDYLIRYFYLEPKPIIYNDNSYDTILLRMYNVIIEFNPKKVIFAHNISYFDLKSVKEIIINNNSFVLNDNVIPFYNEKVLIVEYYNTIQEYLLLINAILTLLLVFSSINIIVSKIDKTTQKAQIDLETKIHIIIIFVYLLITICLVL